MVIENRERVGAALVAMAGILSAAALSISAEPAAAQQTIAQVPRTPPVVQAAGIPCRPTLVEPVHRQVVQTGSVTFRWNCTGRQPEKFVLCLGTCTSTTSTQPQQQGQGVDPFIIDVAGDPGLVGVDTTTRPSYTVSAQLPAPPEQWNPASFAAQACGKQGVAWAVKAVRRGSSGGQLESDWSTFRQIRFPGPCAPLTPPINEPVPADWAVRHYDTRGGATRSATLRLEAKRTDFSPSVTGGKFCLAPPGVACGSSGQLRLIDVPIGPRRYSTQLAHSYLQSLAKPEQVTLNFTFAAKSAQAAFWQNNVLPLYLCPNPPPVPTDLSEASLFTTGVGVGLNWKSDPTCISKHILFADPIAAPPGAGIVLPRGVTTCSLREPRPSGKFVWQVCVESPVWTQAGPGTSRRIGPWNCTPPREACGSGSTDSTGNCIPNPGPSGAVGCTEIGRPQFAYKPVGTVVTAERTTQISGANFLTRQFIEPRFDPGGGLTATASGAFLCRAGTYTNVNGACDPQMTVPTRTLAVQTNTLTLTPLGNAGGPAMTAVFNINNNIKATSQSSALITENIGPTSCILTCNSATNTTSNATLSCTNAFPITCNEILTLP